jgi:chagasin family peptidase inhibitor I42
MYSMILACVLNAGVPVNHVLTLPLKEAVVVKAKVGETVTIRIRTSLRVGYDWKVKEVRDKGDLKLLSRTLVYPTTDKEKKGKPEMIVFKFRTLRVSRGLAPPSESLLILESPDPRAHPNRPRFISAAIRIEITKP